MGKKLNFPRPEDHPICLGTLEEPEVWLNKVKELRPLFKHISDFSQILDGREIWKDRKVWYLGVPCYASKDAEEYRQPALWRTLHSNFDTLYATVCAVLSERFGCPFVVSSILSPPGFHFLEGLTDDYSGRNMYHIDTDVESFLRVPTTNILSVTIPLALPTNSGGYLEYMLDGNTYMLVYALGKIYMWHSRMFHRAGDFTYAEPGIRCTLQIHIYFDKGTGYLYW